MIVNRDTIELIKSFEGLSLTAYLCPAGVPTIGWGTTRYHDRAVRIGDSVTEEQAEYYLKYEVEHKARLVQPMFRDDLSANQFGALTSFAYNLGEWALKISTLRKKVNANPSDITIRTEFGLWVNIHDRHGKLVKLEGLVRRREAEANLYYKK